MIKGKVMAIIFHGTIKDNKQTIGILSNLFKKIYYNVFNFNVTGNLEQETSYCSFQHRLCVRK